MTNNDKIHLEQMIDNYSLRNLLKTIAIICFEKANHIRKSYADNITSEIWDETAEIWDETGCVLWKLSITQNIP